MTAAPPKKRVRKKRRLETKPPKASREFASKACAFVADHIRDHLVKLAPQEDSDFGMPADMGNDDYRLFHFARNVLLEVAAGRDPEKLIDRRKRANSPRSRAIQVMMDAMRDGSCDSMNDVYRAAAERLGRDERNMMRYWSDYVAATGIVPMPSWAPSTNPPGHAGHPAATFVKWLAATRRVKKRTRGGR